MINKNVILTPLNIENYLENMCHHRHSVHIVLGQHSCVPNYAIVCPIFT